MTATSLNHVSGLCQRWNDRRHSWRHVSQGGFDRRQYDVQPVPEMMAKQFVEQHHYSGSYPATRLRYGIFEGSELVGVAVLSVPVRKETLIGPFPALVPYRESLELGRFVLIDRVPANAETFFLGRIRRLARVDGIRGIVSFSDPMPRTDLDTGAVVFGGHVGLIYQADNAIYVGRASPDSLWLLPSGVVFSRRSAVKIRKQERGHGYAEEKLIQYGAPPSYPMMTRVNGWKGRSNWQE